MNPESSMLQLGPIPVLKANFTARVGYHYTINLVEYPLMSECGLSHISTILCAVLGDVGSSKVCNQSPTTWSSLLVSPSTQDPVTVSADCANGQDIRASYELSYTSSSGTSITTCVVNGTDCSNCSCQQDNAADCRCQPPVPQFSGEGLNVTVTAENIVGSSSLSRNISELIVALL